MISAIPKSKRVLVKDLARSRAIFDLRNSMRHFVQSYAPLMSLLY